MNAERGRLTFAILLSLQLHALLLSLIFAGQGIGLPGFAFPWQKRWALAPDLRVMLMRSAAAAPSAGIGSPPAPQTRTNLEPAAPPADGAMSGEAVPAPAPITQVAVIALERAEEPAFLVPPPPPTTIAPRAGQTKTLQPRNEAEARRAEAEQMEIVVEEDDKLARQQQAQQLEAERIEAERREAARQATARLEEQKREEARQATIRAEAARLEAERIEIARLAEARREAQRQEEARLAATRVEAARREAERVEAERLSALRAKAVEAERRETARLASAKLAEQKREEALQAAAQAEAARREAERRETEALATAKLEAQRQQARLAAARAEADRLAAERREAARSAAAKLEAQKREEARQTAARLDVEKLEAERRETARLAAAKLEALKREEREEDERRIARRQAMGRQLDEEAARARLPLSLSTARRVRLWGRSDPNIELVEYAEAWARRIQLNTPVETVSKIAKQPHTHPMVTVALRSDGSVESINFVISSGVADIDEAIRRIVLSHAPYPAFPPGLSRQYDVIEIRRTWQFDSAVRLY
ncbi:TonB C-terminal domain-containing protein [Niveibacterium terrae]|uniref:TonB C-terminal domain-containing protein n=1 Tax=Niveibacterium terrae TaxID=3373598 RepID=UPI003A8E410C